MAPQDIEIFTTGMTTDLRRVIRVNRRILRPFQSIQHFEVFPDRLQPKRDWVLDTNASTNKLSRFTFHNDISGYTLWGLGLNGSNRPLLLKKSGDAITGSWVTPANNVASGATGTLVNPFLHGFKGSLYFLTSGGLNRYTIATTTMTDNWQVITPTHTATPVVHPRTGATYFFFDNNVYQLDPNGTWHSTPVQTLPAEMYITSATPLGNNLAIGAAPLNGQGNSTVYLWDLTVTSSVSSINFTESIDWGTGAVAHLATILGRLVGVSNDQLDTSYGNSLSRLVVRVYNGTVAQEVGHITTDAVSANPIGTSYSTDGDKLYFPASLPFLGDQRNGIWSVDSSGTFNIEATEPTMTTDQRISTIYHLGKAWFISRSDNNVYRQNDQASFTNTSIIETALYGDRYGAEQFKGVTVSFAPLISGQTVTLKYRPAGSNTWVSMGTQSTVGKTALYALGTALRTAPILTEYQFRVESVGATITGINWMTEPYDVKSYG